MSVAVLLLVFLVGLAVGSFVNVVIYRTLEGISYTRGRSFCDECKRQLSWYENIPLVSFLLLGGRCRTCKKRINWTYPVVELATGLLFLWWATLGFAFFSLSQFPLSLLQPIFWLAVGLLLTVVFFADLWHGIIPDFAVGLLFLLTLGYRLLLLGLGVMRGIDLLIAVVAALVTAVFFGGIYRLTRSRGIGFGDVKLAPALVFLLGYPRGVVALFLSFVAGGVIGLGLLLLGRKKRRETLPFGPFLVVGTVVGLVFGEALWTWYWTMLVGG